jgi:hypothetical protein
MRKMSPLHSVLATWDRTRVPRCPLAPAPFHRWMCDSPSSMTPAPTDAREPAVRARHRGAYAF